MPPQLLLCINIVISRGIGGWVVVQTEESLYCPTEASDTDWQYLANDPQC